MNSQPILSNKSSQEQTRRVVRSYHDAWVSGDVSAAGAFLADEIPNPAPFNGFSPAPISRTDYLDVLAKFRRGVTGVDMISELYGEAEATLVYDVHLATGRTFTVAEHFRLTDGVISKVILVFDATP
ncbi:MAG: hypothetical protein IVW55_06450 [Chloroflexi bacterium]|nr:hypothetical protein [Chloroflexota bacterium]